MKNKLVTCLSLALFICLASYSLAQNRDVVRKKIVPVKIGQGELINGTCKISFEGRTFENYYSVVLTPLNEVKGIYISGKNKEYFVVNGKGKDSKIMFDYIVFMEVELPNKSRPQQATAPIINTEEIEKMSMPVKPAEDEKTNIKESE